MSGTVQTSRILIMAALAGGCVARAQSGWRGDGTGRYPEATPVLEWSAEKNIIWSTRLPTFSNSQPLLLGNRVFVGCESDELYCLDAGTGAILWHQASPEEETLTDADRADRQRLRAELEPVRAERARLQNEMKDVRAGLKQDAGSAELKAREKALQATIRELDARLAPLNAIERPPTHATNGYSSPTPVTDGVNVFVQYGTGVVASYTPDGVRRWICVVQKSVDSWGHSASPVLSGGVLVVAVIDVFGLDPVTGREVWRTPSKAHWGSPLAATIDGQAVVLTTDGQLLDAADGRVLLAGIFSLEYNSAMIHDGVVYTYDRKTARAQRLPASLAPPVRIPTLWSTPIKPDRYYTSPLFAEGLLYGITRGGVLSVIKAESGEKVYERKLDLGGGTYYASPTLAGGHVFLSVDSGTTAVVEPGPEYKEIGRNRLGGFRSTPIFSGDRMYLRGLQQVYCIGPAPVQGEN